MRLLYTCANPSNEYLRCILFTLNILCKKNQGVEVVIATAGKGSLSAKDITKFNAQYPKLSVKTTKDFHDRFLILDKIEVYHIGASIK